MRPFATLAHVLVTPRSPQWDTFVGSHEPLWQPYLDDLGVVPAQWTHMTMQGIFGTVDTEAMVRITQAIRSAGAPESSEVLNGIPG